MHSIIEKPAKQAIDSSLYGSVAELVTAYAHAIDDGQIDRWPEFFTDDALYLVTTRENHDAGLPIGIIRCKGRGMMIDRVKAFHTANIFEPHSYNHIVGRLLITRNEQSGTVMARSSFQIVRIMETGRMELFATGKYLDEIAIENGVAKFKERVIVLDSRNVDILIVVPL